MVRRVTIQLHTGGLGVKWPGQIRPSNTPTHPSVFLLADMDDFPVYQFPATWKGCKGCKMRVCVFFRLDYGSLVRLYT